VYEPENQAQITAYNSYVQPVDGVKEIFEKEDPELAESQLVFPDETYTENCSTQVDPPGSSEEVAEVEREFQSVITG
jgi:spermidine/putrescine transport system substrate-binding protein